MPDLHVSANPPQDPLAPPMLTFFRRIDDGITVATLTEADAAPLFAVVEANRAHLRQWTPWLDQNTQPAHTAVYVESIRKQAAAQTAMAAAIRVDGQIVGMAGMHAVDWSNRSATIGYWLAKDFQGRGIVTRTCRSLVDFAFAALNMNRIVIACAVENRRSRAIPERLGFHCEGVAREAEWLYTHYVDHAIYSLLQREWQARWLQELAPSSA